MVASQNGWRANDVSVTVVINIPGGTLRVHKLAAPVFQHLATRFHNEVEALVWPGCWGYAERDVRGSTDISNHASGTAIDLNAPKHPLGTVPTANYSAAQIAKIHEIIAFYEGVIRWGGDYVGRKDGMHFEINDGVDEAQLARIVAKIQAPAPAPAPVPAPAPAFDVRNWRADAGATGQIFVNLQNWANVHFPAYCHIAPTAPVYGPATVAFLAEFARRSGIAGADGRNIGPQIATALFNAGFRG